MSKTLKWAWVCVVTLLALDATIGRWLLRLTATFTTDLVRGGKASSNRLTVFLPGIFSDGRVSAKEIAPVLERHSSEVMYVGYGFWRLMSNDVIRQTAQAIGFATDHRKSLVIFGASVGAKFASHVIRLLTTEYGWEGKSITLIMGDTSPDHRTFKQPGKATSQILRWLFAGPLVSVLVGPLLKPLYVGPDPANIEAGLDVSYVQREAVRRMMRIKFSATCDQQRYLYDGDIDSEALRDVGVVYLACVRDNVTVHQPEARQHMQERLEPIASSFIWIDVDSTHCGFMERQGTWRTVLKGIYDSLD